MNDRHFTTMHFNVLILLNSAKQRVRLLTDDSNAFLSPVSEFSTKRKLSGKVDNFISKHVMHLKLGQFFMHPRPPWGL